MPQKIDCPSCGQEVKVKSKNPQRCECRTEFNLVTRSVASKIEDLPEEEMEKLISEFSKVGEWFMQQFSRRFSKLRLIEKEKGLCSSCGKEKNLTMELKGQTEKYCTACGQNYIFGEEVRKELVDEAKKKFPIPRATYIHLAFRPAKSQMRTWLKNNWGKILGNCKIDRQFSECKQKGKDKEPSEENWEIKEIRERWRKRKAPMSPFRFFDLYYGEIVCRRGKNKGKKKTFRFFDVRTRKKISKRNQRKRRERLKKLGKITEVKWEVAKPICQNCQQLKLFQWGYECSLDEEFKRSRPARIPTFFQTKIKYPSGVYLFTADEDGVYRSKLSLWEKERPEVALHGDDWIEEYYGRELVYSDNTRYPEIYKHHKAKEGKKIEYFFIFPHSQTSLIQDEGWQHLIAYTPTTTCVLSSRNGKRKVKFFWHKKIPELKEKYFNQQQEAQKKEAKRYFKKPRKTGSRRVRLMLHNEAKEVTKYLNQMPGKAILLNMKKTSYKREEAERKELNRRLRIWNDSIFRSLLKYRLELRGHRVEEKEFQTNTTAVCPDCRAEIGGSWQDLVIIERFEEEVENGNLGNIKCERCGRDRNISLAIALTSISS